MVETTFCYFEFGEFRLDAHRRILQKRGETIHLTPRSFDLLCVMVENAGRVLTHDELLEKVWAGTFVEQGNLKKTISALRQALGESPQESEIITTVPRRGYRFSAVVRPLAADTILIRETRAEILVEEIEELPDQKTLEAPQTNFFDKIKRHKIAAACIFLVALGAILFGARQVLNSRGQRFSVENLRTTRLISGDSIRGGLISGDGNLFVYSVYEKGVSSLWARDTVTGGATQIFQMRNASIWFYALTPDGKYIYFTLNTRDELSKTGLYRIPTIGGVPEKITEKNFQGLKFSPDGKRLAAMRLFTEDNTDRTELLTMNTDGSDEKQTTLLPKYRIIRGFDWSPDGASLVYAARIQIPDQKARSYIAEVPVNGGEEKIILPEQETLFAFDVWMPDGKSFLLLQREANSEIFQIWQYFPASGEMRRITNDDYSYTSLNTTHDGKILGGMREFGLSSIWISENENFDFRQIASGTNAFYSLAWTADGRLVFSTMENGKEFVGIMNSDGSQKRLLTKGDDGIRPFPAVSNDGKHITYFSYRGGDRQVWRIDFDGRNLTQLTRGTGAGEAKLLADGQTLIYSNYSNAAWTLIKQTANGDTVQITDADTQDWDISPDEKYLAYFAIDQQTKKMRLFIRELQNGAMLKTFDVESVNLLHWTPDNQSVTYTRFKEDLTEIVVQPIDGGAERVISTLRGEHIKNFDWSPDGRRIALVRYKNQAEAILIRSDEMR
jgi:Tol biopolymer transport system component/DNA-binding winged helix-turn-helix (wHTH) protein